MAIQGARPAHGQIAPNLIVPNTLEAIDFYRIIGSQQSVAAALRRHLSREE